MAVQKCARCYCWLMFFQLLKLLHSLCALSLSFPSMLVDVRGFRMLFVFVFMWSVQVHFILFPAIIVSKTEYSLSHFFSFVVHNGGLNCCRFP